VTNTVIWGGDAWGMSVKYSANVFIEKVSIIMGRQIGLAVVGSHNVIMNDVIVADI